MPGPRSQGLPRPRPSWAQACRTHARHAGSWRKATLWWLPSHQDPRSRGVGFTPRVLLESLGAPLPQTLWSQVASQPKKLQPTSSPRRGVAKAGLRKGIVGIWFATLLLPLILPLILPLGSSFHYSLDSSVDSFLDSSLDPSFDSSLDYSLVCFVVWGSHVLGLEFL